MENKWINKISVPYSFTNHQSFKLYSSKQNGRGAYAKAIYSFYLSVIISWWFVILWHFFSLWIDLVWLHTLFGYMYCWKEITRTRTNSCFAGSVLKWRKAFQGSRNFWNGKLEIANNRHAVSHSCISGVLKW